jgi:hypothetical protein
MTITICVNYHIYWACYHKYWRRSARRECLDYVLIFHEKQLYRVLRAYVDYFYLARSQQGISRQGSYLRFTRVWNTKYLCSSPEWITPQVPKSGLLT